MKDFFSTAKFKILVALAVVLAGMMAWAGANNRLTSAPQELLGAAAVPFQKIGALLSEGVSGVVTKYAEYDSIVEENEQLKQENYDLRQQLVDYDKLKAENEAFRDLNNIREQNPEFEYASAFVIGRDPLDQFGGFTVDAGTLDNVKKGDVVVSDKGYLVGIVLEPGLTSSKVLTILSPSLNAAGVVSRTRDNGILTGDSAYSGDGLTTFTGLPRDTLATVGDEIITTGLGEVFPADILVGTVQELVPEASGKTTVAVVKPGEDILTLKHVQIIINRERRLQKPGCPASDARKEEMHHGITAQTQPANHRALAAVCFAGAAVRRRPDHTGLSRHRGGKAGVSAAAVPGGGRAGGGVSGGLLWGRGGPFVGLYLWPGGGPSGPEPAGAVLCLGGAHPAVSSHQPPELCPGGQPVRRAGAQRRFSVL